MDESKVALITGGARRVGASIAEALAARGMALALHCHRSAPEALALAARLTRRHGQPPLLLEGDLRDPELPQQLVAAVLDRFGRLDALVNNAARYQPTPMGAVEAATWDQIMAINLRAPFLLAQAAAPALRARDGCIVNLGDFYGSFPLPGYVAHSVSKAGLLMLTRGLAKELGPAVRVNAVSPYLAIWAERTFPAEGTREELIAKTAMKRAGIPEDIAQAVAFLILDAPFITGQNLTVDGGRSLY